jgi:ABC-type Zn uptake system ZnuABC Zn-binding protein ZnuA
MKKEGKKFDAVAFQRERRKELSDLYNANPTEFWKRLEKLRKKYRNKFRQQEKHWA